MNRAQRRMAERASRRPAPPKRHIRPRGGMIAIDRSSPYTEDEAARLSLEARLGWQHILDGSTNADHFDNLCMAINVIDILAEGLGGQALEVTTAAKHALNGVRDRYVRIGRFGADAASLRDVPPALDFHDECLRHFTPHQFTKALEEVLRRVNDMKESKT